MIHINTLATKLNKPLAFHKQFVIVEAKTEALVNMHGKAMMFAITEDDPRFEVLDLIDDLMDRMKAKKAREVPVTYQMALNTFGHDGKPLINFVAKFNAFGTARDFMKRHNLWKPHFTIVTESVLKTHAIKHPSVLVTDSCRSKRVDWMRRGMMIPIGYFSGGRDLSKFHHKSRMLRDQAFAHFRWHGVLNPSRREVNELFNAQSAPFPG